MALLERDHVLRRFDSLLREAESGNGRLVLVHGEAGIGKTSVASAFVESIGDRAFVLWGSCDDLLTARTLGPVRDMAMGEASLSAALRTDDRDAVYQTFNDLITRTLRPTLAVFEDVHWADDATLDLLKFIGRRLDATHALVLLTARHPFAPDRPLQAMLGDVPAANFEDFKLEPLSLDAVKELADFSDRAKEVWHISGGNPFFVSELVRSPADRMPNSIRNMVQGMVARLPSHSRHLVELISVVPKRVELSLLDEIDPSLKDQIDDLLSLGILVLIGNGLEFRHELVRTAVEADLSEMRRRALNSAVLKACEAVGADISRRAHHARESGDTEAMLRILPTAARAAAQLMSFKEAVSHLRTLDPLLDRLALTDQADLLDIWVEMEHRTYGGDLSLSERVIDLRRSLQTPRELGVSLLAASRIAQMNGRRSQALARAHEAASVLEDVGGEPLASAYAELSRLAMVGSEADRALEYGNKALEHAPQGSLVRANALNSVGTVNALRAYPEGVEMLEEAIHICALLGEHADGGRARGNLAEAALHWRDLETASKWFGAAEPPDLAESPNYHIYWKTQIASLQLHTGEWDSAEALVRGVLSSPSGQVNARVRAAGTLARLKIRQGDNESWDILNEAWDLAETNSEFQYVLVAAEAASEALVLGITIGEEFPERCLAALDQAVQTGFPWFIGELAMWLWLGGLIDSVPPQAPDPILMLGSGSWRATAEWFDAKGFPYERAVALSLGDVEAQLEALRILDALGAHPLASKIRQQLRSEGVEGVPRGSIKATRDSPLGLTPRQSDVLVLLGEELSNAEIAERLYISSRTVEKHVAVVLEKLNVTSRNDAVAAANEAGFFDMHAAPP